MIISNVQQVVFLVEYPGSNYRLPFILVEVFLLFDAHMLKLECFLVLVLTGRWNPHGNQPALFCREKDWILRGGHHLNNICSFWVSRVRSIRSACLKLISFNDAFAETKHDVLMEIELIKSSSHNLVVRWWLLIWLFNNSCDLGCSWLNILLLTVCHGIELDWSSDLTLIE